MKKIASIFLLLSCVTVFSQPYRIDFGLNEIEILSAKGDFESILLKPTALLECETITASHKVLILTVRYLAYRGSLKYKEAELPLLEAKSILEKNKLPLSFEFRLLLAENYAHLANIGEYQRLIQPISERILASSNPNDTLLGRFYLTSFRTTNNEVYLSQAIDHLQNALLHFEKLDDPPIFYYA